MADFNNPTLTSLYTDMLAGLKSRDVSALQWLDGSTDTNVPSGAKRWNAQNNYFEKFNGTAWGALSTKYMIDVDKLDGCTVNDVGTSITDIWTANKTTTALSAKLDSVTYTASDILAKIKTVDGATSGLDADLLDGMHATNSNTVSSVVSRDASGNFSAGTITATLSGNADSATTAASCSGNAASATTAASCSGNAASATYATTQAVGTSNTTIATTAFVYANSVNTLTDLGVTSTAAELNTLDGVTATATHLNYINTLSSNAQTQLSGKANLASPALSGLPTAPTATVGTNTTQIATTAFVLANIPLLTAGTKLEAQSIVGVVIGGTTLTKKKEISVGTGGVITVSFGMYADYPGDSVAQIYVNGVARGTLRTTTSTTTITYTENITVVAGDLVQLYAKAKSYDGVPNALNFKIFVASPKTSFVIM